MQVVDFGGGDTCENLFVTIVVRINLLELIIQQLVLGHLANFES